MSISSLIDSEAGITLVGSALGAIWTFFRSRDWYAKLRRRRFSNAVQALEAGVDKTYREYVRTIKESREDGKLTREENRDARRRARRSALEYGATTGVDVLRELGDTYMDLWISKLVRKAKRAANASSVA